MGRRRDDRPWAEHDKGAFMGKAGLVCIGLLLMGAGLANAQVIPNPPPDKNPSAWHDSDQQYPSAKVCGECHPNQYRQWSVSSHAYANLSPMFNKFEQKINDLASGTIGHFCVRCHASVGTALGERRDIAWWDRSPASREGITCVTCHRIGEGYGKTNAARRITPGSIHEPVFGPFDTTGGLRAISNAKNFHILVSPDEADKAGYLRIHQTAIQSEILVKSEFCATCHQVQVHPGIKLETVWEEYRNSPAAREGITCQQCHMSPTPGQPTPFPTGWAARVNGNIVNSNRPLTDHTFVGPGYPISHPGLFPFRMEESPFTPQQWLKFDYRAQWGSDAFESSASATAATFPQEWQSVSDRKTAWRIVEENLARWEERKKMRLELLENGSRLEGPFFNGTPRVGQAFSFNYKLTNLNRGHNLPSGSLGAQPELWLNVALIGPAGGPPIWESGYLDKYGDVADIESRGVRDRETPFDDQLFNMQAKFITTNLKGTDREMYLPINLDFDQLPFIRPGGAPTSLLNHPPFARMEKHSIPPLGTRLAKYKVPAKVLNKPGTYRLAVRMRGRTEPIYFMDFVGATTDMKRAENYWVTDTHIYAVEFEVR
jgi:nitrate/TMAO reductase-like tetraheme cytochrome c subunit